MTRALLLGLGLVLAGCGSTSIDVSHYDQSCTAAPDCVLVFSGDACTRCSCLNAAINVKEQKRYDADLATARGWCGPKPGAVCLADCIQPVVTCTAGRCGVSGL